MNTYAINAHQNSQAVQVHKQEDFELKNKSGSFSWIIWNLYYNNEKNHDSFI